MEQPIHAGAQPLEDAGLVAFTPCGHWWVYPCHATAEQMHELARFNLGIACSFRLADWQRARSPRAYGSAWLVN